MLLEENLPVLTEVKKRYLAGKSAKDDSSLNFLIEGDNLAALKLLEKTHRGKIDLIYIDPPYNTGNKDFIYNDSYVDKIDTFRHSKWLSFMKKRLQIARCLMSEKGVIFISIDDNEQAQLKLLCDEIFGGENFVAEFPRLATKSGKTPFSKRVNSDSPSRSGTLPRTPRRWRPADIRFPKKWDCTYDAVSKNSKVGAKNVYCGYPMSAGPRSTGEREFEKWCEQNQEVEWFYRNGDKGDEYFSIVYLGNAGQQKLFYPDYILSIGGKTWIIEVKGSFNKSGDSENIDRSAPKKAQALKAYCAKRGIRGGIACYDEGDGIFLLAEDGFSEDKNAECWETLDDAVAGA